MAPSRKEHPLPQNNMILDCIAREIYGKFNISTNIFCTSFIKLSRFYGFMKCEICKEKVEENFLKKVLGTFVKDKKGKNHLVCQNCQKKFLTKEEMIEKL